ncbi:anti-sigma regulatory factor (Ser/Thr protein kinase) [Streptomyces sp. PanSC19]|uniref:ATP-binding protein n=1 Tax=Streptomyces sp. PanSC19 TaxID=1520455 RepID=UPI000FA535B4|nr:ATP-binding protein [Streptomyces sp. PanSC19]ROQ35770.1 anti-sigma regulatory factor (Ser/Thr protein kinase) [Streptomyces sp. PanSC19]
MDTAIASCGCPATLHIRLPSAARAARQARQTAALLLARETAVCPPAVAEDLVLIVSELVTNAVLHADGPYALTVGLEPGRVGVAVSDGSTDLSGRHGRGQRIDQGGRGLKIVRALGADLFVNPSDLGKQVIAVLTW